MADLNNSTRTIHTATYCPTYGAFKGSGAATGNPGGRAIDKATFVASLNIHATEVNRVRQQLTDSTIVQPDNVAGLLRALDVVESMVRDLSPNATLRHAPDFAALSPVLLAQLGKQLSAVRDQLAAQLGDALVRLYQKFADARAAAAQALAAAAATPPEDAATLGGSSNRY